MRYIWDWIDRKDLSERFKLKMIVLVSAVVSAAAGFCVWGIVKLWALNHWSWMMIFTGYPALFAVLIIIIYSLNHNFHNGPFNPQ